MVQLQGLDAKCPERQELAYLCCNQLRECSRWKKGPGKAIAASAATQQCNGRWGQLSAFAHHEDQTFDPSAGTAHAMVLQLVMMHSIASTGVP